MPFDDIVALYEEHIGKKTPEGGKARVDAAANRESFIGGLSPLEQIKTKLARNKSFQREVKTDITNRPTTEADLRKHRETAINEKITEDVKQQIKAGEKTQEEIDAEEQAKADRIAERAKDMQIDKEARAAAAKQEKPSTAAAKKVTKVINETGDIETVLKELINERYQTGVIAKNLLKLVNALKGDTKLDIVFGDAGKNKDGKFDPKNNTATIAGKDGKYTGTRPLEETVLHEILHYLVDHVIDNRKAYLASLPVEQRAKVQAALNRIDQNFKQAKTTLGTKFNIPTMKEFLAETYSNPAFQEALNKVKAAEGKNLFSRIAQNIAAVLGFGGETENLALKQTLTDIEQIIAIPSEFAGKGISYAKQAPKQTLREEGRLRPVAGEKSDTALPQHQLPKNIKYFKDLLFTRQGWRKIVTKLQHDRHEIKHWQDVHDLAKKIYYEGKDKINNIYTQLTRATSLARNYYHAYIEDTYEHLDKAISNLAKATDLDVKDAIDMMHRVLEALHEPERRLAKYLMIAPLSETKNITRNGKKESAADIRAVIFKQLNDKTTTEAQAKQLRAELDAIVFSKDAQGKLIPNPKYVKELGLSPRTNTNKKGARLSQAIDIENELYNTTGLSPAAVAERLENYKNESAKAEIDEVIKYMKELHVTTIMLNKEANYWSQPVSNRVAFYGFENYVPLKGVAKHSAEDEMLDFDGNLMGSELADTAGKKGKELQDIPHSFEGRISVSDNPVLQSMTDAVRAAMRAGRKDLTQSIKNSLAKDKLLNPHGQGILQGRVVKHISFEDRQNKEIIDSLPRENTVFHYNEDGSIDVLEINQKTLREAIRRTYKDSNPLVDMANSVTSKLGQLHTRYNYNFAPLNYVRDTLTNAWALGAEMGPLQAAKFIGQVSSKVAQGSLYKAWKVAALYESKNFKQIEALAKTDPIIQEMVEFIEEGGMVEYLQGISLKSNMQRLNKEIGRSKVMRTADQFNKYVDIWTDMFELSSRSAAFAIAKQNFKSEGLSDKAAAVKAAAYAKNLANFEQVGEMGKGLGALFMFFRPSATGAVRAIEAALPAFQNVDKMVAMLPPHFSAQDKAEYKKNFEFRQKSARYMLTSLMALGSMAYMMSMMMSDDDDLGRNKVMTDDMSQWTRFGRFYLPGFDTPFQMPWGFGLGSFAAAGAQLAAVGTGHQSIGKALGNITTQISLDSFIPIPVSRMNVGDNPALWMLDSLTPSMLRPALEFVVNKNGLGQSIYNDSNRRMGDAFLGGDNIPQVYKDISRWLAINTGGSIDWSPNSIYFLANSYVDGPARIIDSTVNGMYLAAGQKEFKAKTDVPLVGSFIGAAPNVDSREFTSVEKQILDMSAKLNMFKDSPVALSKYMSDNPLAEVSVEIYNHEVGKDLNKLREEAKAVRLLNVPPNVRENMLKVNRLQQNIIKHDLVQTFKAFNIKP
jgi:hypothetical protein